MTNSDVHVVTLVQEISESEINNYCIIIAFIRTLRSKTSIFYLILLNVP